MSHVTSGLPSVAISCGLDVGQSVGCARPGGLVGPDRSLRCEYLVNPLGIDDAAAAAQLAAGCRSSRTARGQRQTAYQVLVASSRSLLEQEQGDCWDSGRVASDQSLHVPYQGQPLAVAE